MKILVDTDGFSPGNLKHQNVMVVAMMKWFSNLFRAPEKPAPFAVSVPPDMPLVRWRADTAFPIPRGQAFRRDLAAGVRLPTEAYWRALHQQWFDTLGPVLQSHSQDARAYTWMWHEQFLMLSSLGDRRTEILVRYCKQAAARILRALPGVAQMSVDGVLPIIVFPDADCYSAYTDLLYAEDEPGIASAGMFMKLVDDEPTSPDNVVDATASSSIPGFGHFILLADEIDQAEPTLVHEMTHALLSHLQMPLWLEEGIATAMENTVDQGAMDPSYVLNRRSDLRQRHARYWNDQTKIEFWNGSAFANGASCELAYDMAYRIVSELARDMPRFTAFVSAARAEDFGAEGLRSAYGLPLDVLIDSYLQLSR